jgi:hypothetical protein
MNLIPTTFAVVLCVAMASSPCNAAQGFRANLGGINQVGVPDHVYTLVKFTNIDFDTSNYYNTATHAWYPPAGLVELQSQVWLNAGAEITVSPTTTFVAKIVKNATFNRNGKQIDGTAVCTGIGTVGSAPYTAAMNVDCSDLAHTGDYYQVIVYASAYHGVHGGTSTIDGNHMHTFFSGISIQ